MPPTGGLAEFSHWLNTSLQRWPPWNGVHKNHTIHADPTERRGTSGELMHGGATPPAPGGEPSLAGAHVPQVIQKCTPLFLIDLPGDPA